MALDARRVLLFRDVARAGSISAAARAVGWTQPAVSQHLARLEREAGGPLLLRGPGGVTPTEAGRALLLRADVVAAELHSAEEELAALTQLRAGRVRLVAFPSAAATLVPEAVSSLAATHAEVEVGLDEAEPPEALAAVAAGDADLALVFGYDGPPEGVGTLTWRRLLTEPVHLVVPPGRRGPGRRGLAALADDDWIGGCVRCRTHLVACCEAAGFTPTVRHTTDDYVVVQNLVARGLGVTVLPASALAAYRHPDVRVVPMTSLGRRHVGLAFRPGADGVPATAALVSQLVAAVPSGP
ncbi:LysR family transcriptional regulator [Nocardioides sp.]|uniref:LysR family transcriptional regulator n=1 Tax=Nocardioides sp. TaxID=35761 RepID=UPI0027289E73|nr:LysR family transcriptional regulator [Nocardioides sp.]MDO9456995.1 LysR family transcriptional regulator [Nocardioides sp.]